MRFGNLKLRTKVMAGGVVPIILLVVLSVAGAVSLRSLVKDIYRVDLTHKVIRNTVEIESQVTDLLTALRGYLLTGDTTFLESFNTEENVVRQGLLALEKLVRHDEAQTKLLKEFQEVIEKWKTESVAPAIALRKEITAGKNINDMAMLVVEGKGKQYFDTFRHQTNSFVSRERSRLDKWRTEAATEASVEQLSTAFSLVDYENTLILQAMEILVTALDMEIGQRGYLLSGKEEFLGPYEVESKRLFALIEKQKKAVGEHPDQVKLLEEMEAGMRDWVNNVAEPEIRIRKQIAASRTMEDIRVLLSKQEHKQYFDRFREIIATFKGREEALLKERQSEADSTSTNTQKVVAIGTLVVIFISLTISYFLSGTITKPMEKATELAEVISKGDLSRTLEVKTRDEVGRLCSALNEMVHNLREQTKSILEGVTVLAAAAAEISATVLQVATSTAQTSATVTETTTAFEQLRQAAKLASEEARNVAESSQHAAHVAESGRKATEETIQKMHLIKVQMGAISETVVRLSEKSQAVEDIITTVQDIADQSNVLAVNASIEAARAGEQGKGFAVVAQEIKSLADQSKQATEQVRIILQDTKRWVSAVVMATEQGSKAVDAGVHQSSEAGQAIDTLSGSVAASSKMSMVIKATSEQQSTGVDQVAIAFASIERAVHQNRDGFAQLEAAGQRLSGLGDRLKQLVEYYSVQS